MKITSTSVMPIHREPAKPAAAQIAKATQATDTATPAPSTESSGHAQQKAAPPGLERALSRLQGIPDQDRTNGQSNAISSISRNLARYRETEAISTPPVTTTTDGAAPLPEDVVA